MKVPTHKPLRVPHGHAVPRGTPSACLARPYQCSTAPASVRSPRTPPCAPFAPAGAMKPFARQCRPAHVQLHGPRCACA
eukprot:7382613-Prymnesium_polylepis.1